MNDQKFQKKLKRIKKRGERQKAKQELMAQYAEYYPHREGAKVSNIMLVVIIAIVLAYTVASFVLQFCTSVEISSTLTTCVFAFVSVELVSLAGIKTSKILKKSKENEDEREEDLR